MSANAETVAAPRAKIYAVAKYQRWVILSLVLNIAFMAFAGLRAAGVFTLPPVIEPLISYAALALIAFQIYSIFKLARQFTSIVFAIFAAIAMFLPIISLIALLIYNQRATTFLQQNGVPVGFLGVNPKSL